MPSPNNQIRVGIIGAERTRLEPPKSRSIMPSGAAGQTLAGIMGLTATEQQRIVRWNKEAG